MKVFFVLSCLLFLPAGASAGEMPPLPDEITTEAVVALMNEYRAHNQLPPLTPDQRLMSAAEDRMREMEELAYWSHVSPEGRSPFFWVKYRSYRFTVVGENLARGFETSHLLVSSWMDSRGHRENILEARYRHVGVAVIEGGTTGRYPGKSVVVLFGSE